MHPVAMTQDDEPVPGRPDGQIERMRRDGRARRPASYAPAVPRLAADTWRGCLIDLEH